LKLLPLLLIGVPAFAGTVVFSDFGPGDTYGGGAWVVNNSQSVAAPFTPTSGGLLSQIRVVLGYQSNVTSGLTVDLTASGTSPNSTILEEWSLPTSSIVFGGPIITLQSIANPALSAGSEYWLTVAPSGPLFSGAQYTWAINTLSVQNFDTSHSGGVWTPANNLTPVLDVTVGPADTTSAPEPSTLGTMVLAAGLFAGQRFRKR
jgi:hypothetical protein